MSKFDDQFEYHEIHKNLSIVNEEILDLEEKGIEDSSFLENISRIKMVINNINSLFKKVDPIFIVISILDQMNEIIKNIINDFNTFNNNKNPDIFNTSNSRIDNLIKIMMQLYIPYKIDDVKSSITSFRKSVAQHYRKLEESRNNISIKINNLNTELQKIEESIERQKTRVDAIISDFQSKFLDSQSKRDQKFSERIEDLQKIQSNLQDKLKSEEQKFTSDLATKVNETMMEMNKKKKEAEDLIFVISNTGMVGGYQKIANKHRNAAKIWHYFSVGAIFGIIFIAIWTFITSLNTSISLSTVGARVFVAVAFGILAAYSARQAEKNEESERKNRKMELELASISPYLSGLPEDVINRLKERLAEKLFGQQEVRTQSRKVKIKGSTTDIIKLFLDFFRDYPNKPT